MGEYDLREFKPISARELAAQFGGHRVNVRQALTRLVRAGLFEQGPNVLRRPTFRIRPAFLMTTKALRAQTQWLQEREERMSIFSE
jgi:DNA-binding IclR family transcriptional regulator